MKILQSWLQSLLEAPLGSHQILEAIEAAGIEIEEVVSGVAIDPLIVVAEIIKIEPHPNADRLQIATVRVGDSKTQVVCGAPNIKVGQRVPFAQVGVRLHDGTTIQEAEIRGVVSKGMLCSSRELGLSDDHSGVLELGAEADEGTTLNTLYESDTVIDVKSAANRPDLQSLIGVAREVVAHSGVGLNLDDADYSAQLVDKPQMFRNELPDLVPQYALAELSVPAGQDSPDWMQQRLRQVGVKPINLVVDITNYVMLETGQPLHAFDATKLKGAIVIRRAIEGEKLTTLDGSEKILTSEDIVIADEVGAQALAGVMGGVHSEISNTTNTVLLEAATFDATTVRRSAQRHGIRTEASARFERSLPLPFVNDGLGRALKLLSVLAKAKVVKVEHTRTGWPWIQHIGMKPARVSRLAGIEIDAGAILDALHKLGFSAATFDIAEEARSHLKKPYKWGAKYRVDGTNAFDCSYLIDYIYSLINLPVGHTAMAQSESGWEVEDSSKLQPGDVIYRGGPWEKLDEQERKGVSHVYLYIGNGRVVHAKDNERNKKGEWQKISNPCVVEEDVEVALNDPQFMGIRRYVEKLDDYIAVTAPYWRPDIRIEEDVLEEVIKLVGLEKLPSTLPAWRPEAVAVNTILPRLWKTRELYRGLGAFEVATYPFISENQAELFGLEDSKRLALKNPRSIEQSYLRTTLLPGLIDAIARNRNYDKSINLFEVAKIFKPQTGEILPLEQTKLGVLVSGGEPRATYLKLKHYLDQLSTLGRVNLKFTHSEEPSFMIENRRSEIVLNEQNIGFIGQVDPKIARINKLKSLAYFELNWDDFSQAWQDPTYRPLSKYQSSTRDVTFLVPDLVTWQQIEDTANQYVEKTTFLDEYIDAQQKRAITIRFEFVSAEHTLTDDEVDKALAAAVTTLEKQLQLKVKD